MVEPITLPQCSEVYSSTSSYFPLGFYNLFGKPILS